eukprot:6212764-Pleurochrysis_carterae.AAC.3
MRSHAHAGRRQRVTLDSNGPRAPSRGARTPCHSGGWPVSRLSRPCTRADTACERDGWRHHRQWDGTARSAELAHREACRQHRDRDRKQDCAGGGPGGIVPLRLLGEAQGKVEPASLHTPDRENRALTDARLSRMTCGPLPPCISVIGLLPSRVFARAWPAAARRVALAAEPPPRRRRLKRSRAAPRTPPRTASQTASRRQKRAFAHTARGRRGGAEELRCDLARS